MKGKDYERTLRLAFERIGWLVHRNVDAMIGKGNASVQSKPDLTVFNPDGEVLLVEAKATKGKSIPFNRLSSHQVRDLAEFSALGSHAYGLVALHFYDGSRKKDRLHRSILLSIHTWMWAANDLGRKSMPMDAAAERGCEMGWIPGTGWTLPEDWKERV